MNLPKQAIPKSKSKLKRAVILIAIVLVSIQSQCQQVSVLPQFFAANPIIKRDPTFEQLQKYLTDANRNSTLGLSENITKKLTDVRHQVERIHISFLQFDSATYIARPRPGKWIQMKYTFFDKEDTKSICKTTELNLDTLSTRAAKILINQVLIKYSAPSSSSTSLLRYNKIVLYLLTISLKGGETDIGKFDETNMDNHVFERETLANITTFANAQIATPISPAKIDEILNELNIAMSGLVENMKSKIGEGLYQLDESIQKSKSDLSKRLISANTGVGVNQDEGSFGGGLILTWTAKDLNKGNGTQFSVFTNGVAQVGKDSTATKQPFLCGVNFEQQIGHRTQISFLASTRYNQQSLNGKNWLFEGGLGFLTKSSNNFIWGISAFYQYINESISSYDKDKKQKTDNVPIYSLFTAGLTFRGDSNTSPTVLIGVSNQKGWTPILQISYPINFGRQ